jgi:ribosomal protein L37AE/L43A
MTNCPDCGRPVETSLLRDPAGKSEPVTIWDCSWCQRSGFVPASPAPLSPAGP